MTTEQKKLTDKTKLMKYIPAGLQILASIFFLITLLVLNILPTLYIIAAVAILAALAALLTFWAQKADADTDAEEPVDGKPRMVLIPQIISIILSIVVVIGGIYIIKGSSFLNTITGAETQTNVMSLVVLDKSKYQEIDDLKGKVYGICTQPALAGEQPSNSTKAADDQKNIDITMKEIKSQQGALYIEEAPDLKALKDALYTKTADAIVINEAYRSIIEESSKDFKTKTRTIWTYRITEDIQDQAEHVDVTTDPFNVYISGIDTIGRVSTVSRTDVNMILTVNPITREILMTSMPRDYYVPLASYGTNDKLTHSGIYGINESIATIEGFMGIDINYYARVNFTSVKKIVDAIGGISVYSDRELELEKMHIKQGMNKMDGKTALRYARERYSYVEGDKHRVQNQQEVMKGMVKKVTSPAVISSYSKLLKVAGKCMETNMKAADLQKLAKMQLEDGGKWHMTGYQLDGTEDVSEECYSAWGTELSIVVPDYDSIALGGQYINKVMKGEKLVIE